MKQITLKTAKIMIERAIIKVEEIEVPVVVSIVDARIICFGGGCSIIMNN